MVLAAASLVCMLTLSQVPVQERQEDAAGLHLVRGDAKELQRRGDYVGAARLLESYANGLDGDRNPSVRSEAERVAARYHAVATSFARAQRDPKGCGVLFARVLLAGHRFVPLTDDDAARALRLLDDARPGLSVVMQRRSSPTTELASTRPRERETERARRVLEEALTAIERGRR